MSWNQWVRQIHRWLSIAFSVGVVVNIVHIVAWGDEEPAVWVYLLALLPLALLLFTGLYLFVLPYATKWRSGRRGSGRRPPCPAGSRSAGVEVTTIPEGTQ